MVENQLAERIPEVTGTLERLLNEGLDRHDAIHAIGSVLAEHLFNIMKTRPAGGDPHAAYFAALESLSAAKWHGTDAFGRNPRC